MQMQFFTKYSHNCAMAFHLAGVARLLLAVTDLAQAGYEV